MNARMFNITKLLLPALCVGTILTVLAEKRVAPPEPGDIVGTWMGFDQDLLTFCRLELHSDGKGFFWE